MEFQSCLDKQDALKSAFSSLSTQEEKYHRVIEMGRETVQLPANEHLDEYIVQGCQSLLYLKVECIDHQLVLSTYSDALISSGLASILISIYQNEPPEAVFKCPPTVLKSIGLLSALSPSRANGLKSLFQKLQKDAVKWLK